MAKITIDLTNYKDRTGSRVPEGRYRVQVEDVEESTARTGNTMITLFLRVVGGTQDGATILDRLTLTDRAMFRVVSFLQAIGYPTPKKKLQIDIEKFIGKYLDIDVEDGDPYQGRVRSEVRNYMRIEKPVQEKKRETEDIEDAMDDFDLEDDSADEGPEPENQAEESKEDADGAAGDSDEVDLAEVDL